MSKLKLMLRFNKKFKAEKEVLQEKDILGTL
jgi:hypothetical protein